MGKISGGWILLSKKILNSDIYSKPPLYFKLWLWMLLKANFSDHGNLKRGQLFTTIEEMRESMSYKVGYRKNKPSRKEVRGAYEGLVKGQMIGTAKGTRGLVITICNYDYYQDIKNYEGHSEGHSEGPVKGTLKKKEVKRSIILKDNTHYVISDDEFCLFQESYPMVDVEKEITAMNVWCYSNPAKRKTSRGAKKFINGWLGRVKPSGDNQQIEKELKLMGRQ